MPRNPEIRAAREASRRETAELVAGLHQARDELRTQRDALRREKREREDEVARARRNGEQGPDLQAVQRRIDNGETTWDDVVSGRDDAPSSVRVRATVHRNLDRLAEEVAEDPELAEAAEDARTVHRRNQRESRGL